jgi:hypothetical protein
LERILYYLCIMINEYTIQGYRSYKLSELPISQLIRQLPQFQRVNRLEVLIVDNIVYVKTTNRYDQPRNPYVRLGYKL